MWFVMGFVGIVVKTDTSSAIDLTEMMVFNAKFGKFQRKNFSKADLSLDNSKGF